LFSVITEYVLKWNSGLTSQGDRDGSTPLHLASSFGPYSLPFHQLFKVNPTPVYQADDKGLFPIHVAASTGMLGVIKIILDMFPSNAGLCTAQGQTFLHVAVENQRLSTVSFVCQTPSLTWILNMQDNNGNTALHLAVQAGKFRIFCSLFGNKEVHLSLENKSKKTPIDIARSMLSHGLSSLTVIYSHLYNIFVLDLSRPIK
jgi:ankyrin repeat protein